MRKTYIDCLKKLKEFRKSLKLEKDIKRGKLYFSWIDNKTDKIRNEENKEYLYNNLVNNTLSKYNISKYIYEKANNELKNVIDKNYIWDGKKYKFSNSNISIEDTMLIAKYVILKRGNVVWIDFGFNIGNEFGGMHPAIILKKFEK